MYTSSTMEDVKGSYPSPQASEGWLQEEPSENLTCEHLEDVSTRIFLISKRVSVHQDTSGFVLCGAWGKGQIWVETSPYVHNLDRQRKTIFLVGQMPMPMRDAIERNSAGWGDLRREMDYAKLEGCQQMGGVTKIPKCDSSLDIIASIGL